MRFSQTQTIALVNQKGGCGKTTSTVGLAVAFSRLGYKTCVVDLDPQRNTTKNFRADFEGGRVSHKYTVADCLLNGMPAGEVAFPAEGAQDQNLWIVPGNQNLSSVMHRLELNLQQRIAEGRLQPVEANDSRNEFPILLKNALASLHGTFDVVIIDTPPSLSFEMTSALVAADWFIIPTFISSYDFEGLELLWKTATKIREKLNPTLRFAGVLVGNFDASTVLDREAVGLLKNRFGPQGVFQTLIKRSVKLRHATFEKISIFESQLDGTDGLRTQFLELAKEMINRGTKSMVNQTTNPLPTQQPVGAANG